MPTVNVVLGLVGGYQVADFRHRAAHRVYRAGQAKSGKAVSARSLETHHEAMAAGGGVDDASQAHAVERDETVDILVVAEQRFHAAQIAQFFFAHGADKHDVAHGAHARLVEVLQRGQQCRQSRSIIADARRVVAAVFFAHFDVGAFGKHRVQMRRHHELRSFAVAAAYADDIAFLVDVGIGKPGFLHFFQVILGARFFLERRRGNFNDAYLFLEHAHAAAFDGFQRFHDGRVFGDAIHCLFNFRRDRREIQLRG